MLSEVILKTIFSDNPNGSILFHLITTSDYIFDHQSSSTNRLFELTLFLRNFFSQNELGITFSPTKSITFFSTSSKDIKGSFLQNFSNHLLIFIFTSGSTDRIENYFPLEYSLHHLTTFF